MSETTDDLGDFSRSKRKGEERPTTPSEVRWKRKAEIDSGDEKDEKKNKRQAKEEG